MTARMTYAVRGFALAITVALAPLTVSKGGVVAEGQACAQTEVVTGTCCRQSGAICNAGGGDNAGYCYRASGSCRSGSDPCG